jgi:hypothetical protein
MFCYKSSLFKEQDFYGYCGKNIDGLDEKTYSTIKKYSPLSFLQIGIDPSADNSGYLPKVPPPTCLSLQELHNGEKLTRTDFMNGYVLTKNGILVMKDEKILASQRGIMGAMLKKMALSMFNKNIVAFSMPARFFEPMTSTMCYGLVYRQAPNFLNKAAIITDPVERMKLTSVYLTSILHTGLGLAGPFNSLLGETFQGGFEDGTQVYMEQISHHPAITYALVIGAKNAYKIYGSITYNPKFSGNSLTLTPSGKRVLEFKDKQKIDIVQFPAFKLGGLMMGERSFVMKTSIKLEDKKNLLRLVIIFHGESKLKKEKKDRFEGIIYKYNPAIPFPDKILSLADLKDVEKEIASIEGSWLEYMNIGGVQYWKLDNTKPCRMLYANNPIPSDARFREDLIYLKRGAKDNADKWKDSLEIRQREDKKQRVKFYPDDKS